jgi:hypothetical protein
MKGTRHGASAHGSRSMARWVRQDGGRVVRSSGPYGPLHRRPRLRHGSRRRGAASAASRPPQARARAVRTCVPVSAAARGPASAAAATPSPSDSSRCLSGCHATFRPPSARQRAHTDATPCLTSSSPRGRTWKAPAPRRSARAIGSCPPHPPPEGVLRLATAPADACGGSPCRPGLPLHTVSLHHSRCGLSSLRGRPHFDAIARTMLSHPGAQAPRPHVLVPAACSRLCLALPWHRRRRYGAGALAFPMPASPRGLPAPPRTAPPIRHGAAVRVCGPARRWTSGAGTARAGRALSCLVELAWAGASPGGSAPPDPCQPKRSVVRLVFYCRAVCCDPCRPVLPRRQPAFLLETGWRDVVLHPTPLAAARRLPVAAAFFFSWKGHAM